MGSVPNGKGRIERTVSGEGRALTYTYQYINTLRTVGDAVLGGFRKTTTDANFASSNAGGSSGQQIDDLDYFERVVAHTDRGASAATWREAENKVNTISMRPRRR